jgi:hypothetical protein
MYGSSFHTLPSLPDETILPDKPPAVPTPRSHSTESDPTLLAHETDDGIGSYCLELLSIWARVMSYLRGIKQGQREEAWSPNSTYQQIKSLMFRFETVFPEAHRFHHARFHERPLEDLARDRDYWAPWIFAHMMYHCIHCTLNHPLLHLAEVHRRQKLRSPSFLQHATDQAILHSAWILRILDMLMVLKKFPIHDPFIAHLATITATVLFFLRFSKDEVLAATAAKDFEICRQFLDNMTKEHVHLQFTVST